MPDAPDNVFISSWLPQPALLAHNNVKAFITHGGAGSIQETICYKTPIVGIPIAMDQVLNIQDAVNKKFAVTVNWHEITEEILTHAIEEILSNHSYKEAVDDLSNLIMDQPQHPLDKAVWWLEYILRHPHNIAMRSPTHDLYWFQFFLLDIFFLILISISFLFIIMKKCVDLFRKEKVD